LGAEPEGSQVANKVPEKKSSKKQGKSLKEKRAAKEAKRAEKKGYGS
jgi:hypothetical protein